MNNKIICPYCKKENIKRDGKRKTENRGLIQRYQCKKCKKRFVLDDGFYRMRNHPNKITCAIDLFYRGVSTRKVQEHFKAFYPHNADHSSILRWIRKYSRMIYKFTNKLQVITSNEMQIDEMEYKTKGKQTWFIDTIDPETKFIISSNFVKNRGLNEVKQILRKAKDKAESQLQIVTSDGWMAYPKAINKIFGYSNKKHKYNIEHNQVNASQGEGFNHPIERLHNSIRERTKTFRGFKRVESARALMQGYEVFYNYIRIHQAIGKTPSELAIPELKLTNPNKWLELIHLSNM